MGKQPAKPKKGPAERFQDYMRKRMPKDFQDMHARRDSTKAAQRQKKKGAK